MKVLLPFLFLLVCFTYHVCGRSATQWINAEHRNVDGGSDNLEVESPSQWTKVEEEEEEVEDESASLRKSIIKAMQRNR